MTSTAYAAPVTAERNTANVAVAVWLLACAGMVVAMTIIGAITRLTESGLSMVEWRPLIGTVPPLNEAEWLRVFDLYRETPEYRLRNAGMSLDDFKDIFFWEWFHRVWGRLIGVIFVLPLAWFWLSGRLSAVTGVPNVKRRLLVLLLLGAAQGVMGWYMVESGLVDRPSVSQYRLAAHLGLALWIFALCLWLALALLRPGAGRGAAAPAPAAGWWALVGLSVTIAWGAFVAGLDAGVGFNTWPLMDGDILPPEAFFAEPPFVAGSAAVPVWSLPFENRTMVQFVHRWIAVAAAGLVLWAAWQAVRQDPRAPVRWLAAGLSVAVCLQVLLGIVALLLVVPIFWAALHQAGAVLVLSLLLWLQFERRSPPETGN